MDFVRLSALENRNYGGDFFTPQMLALAFYDILCCFQHFVHLSALENRMGELKD